MTESLADKQKRFARLVPKLLTKLHEMGYEASLGDLYRDPRVHGAVGEKKGYGHPKSAHKNRLAIDINLFKDGKYLSNTEDHEELGQWWEKLDVGCCWGGRFSDGNHYSIEHEGVK